MIVYVVRYYVDKGKEAEYAKFGTEESQPYMRTVPGLREIRGYRNWSTGHVQVEYEFEGYEAWAKYMEQPKTKEIQEKFKALTHDISTEILGPGLLTPEPIRLTK